MTRRLTTRAVIAGAITTLSLVGAGGAAAATGDLDTTFGATLADGTELNAVAIRPTDGATLAVGRSGSGLGRQVVAYFASGGPQVFTFGDGTLRGVVAQADGRAIVAGYDAFGFLVRRVNTSGAVEWTYRGVPGGHANAVALGPNGTIVVAGDVPGPDDDPWARIALVRLRPDGTVDPSFGNAGVSILSLGPDSRAKGVAVQGDGKIVIAGSIGPAYFQATNAFVARANADGSLDGSFASSSYGCGNTGGAPFVYYCHPQGGGASTFNTVALDPAGGIVAGGGDSLDSGPQALLLRLTCAGAPDTGFAPADTQSAGGLVRTPAARNFIGTPYGVNSVVAGPGKGIVGAGRFQDSGQPSAALWGFSGSGARLFATQAPLAGEARGLTIDAAGNYVIAGTKLPAGGGTQGFIARYAGPGAPPSGSTPCGGPVSNTPSTPTTPTTPTTPIASAAPSTPTTPSGNGTTGSSEIPPRANVRLVGLPKGQTLRDLRNAGVRVSVSCQTACAYAVSLRLDATYARRLHLGSRALTVARATGTLSGAGTRAVRLKLASKPKRALARRTKMRFGLVVRATPVGTTTPETARATLAFGS